MHLDRPVPRAIARVLSLILIGAWLFSAIPPAAAAQEATPEASATVELAGAEPEATAETADAPTEVPTQPAPLATEPPALPTAEPDGAAGWQDGPTAEATSAPSGPDQAAATEPAPEPATAAVATGAAAASEAEGRGTARTGILVTVKLGDFFGPPVPNVCMTLVESFLGIWQDNGCTDASGQLLLEPWKVPATTSDMRVEFLAPPGYQDIDDLLVTAINGQIMEYTRAIQPAPPTTATFRAVHGTAGDPVGGACWTLYTNRSLFPGDLVRGPVCDEDGDGEVVMADLAYGSYCYVLAPPDGFRVVGGDTFCGATAERDQITVRGLLPIADPSVPGGATIDVTVKNLAGEPIAGVCVLLRWLPEGADPIDLESGCTGAEGAIRFDDLPPGAFVVSALSVPAPFVPFGDADLTLPDATSAGNLAVTLFSELVGNAVLKAVIGYGPSVLPGACWSYVPAKDGAPFGDPVIGPVCDEDGDGEVVLERIQAGAFCIVVTPPARWERPARDYSFCRDVFGSASWIIGFIPSNEPVVTPSPTPTPTPFPTPPPVEGEANTSLRVRNCGYTGLDAGVRLFDLCLPAGGGIRFALIQGGRQIETLTTDANGFITISLPQRAAFQLRYLEGAAAGWIPGPGEEARRRYSPADAYSFVRENAPGTWSMTVTTVSNSSWNSGTPIGGACYRIVEYATGEELLPPACDTDNDGTVVVGELPARLDFIGLSQYAAEMTSPPPGYLIQTGKRVGLVSAGDPDTWISRFHFNPVQLLVRVVDPDGNPLPGWCFGVSNRLFAFCDNEFAGANDGTVTIDGAFRPGDNLVVTADAYSYGYLPDQQSQLITIGSGPTQEVVFVARPYGTDRADRADVRITVVNDQGYNVSDLDEVCFRLSPAAGVPSGELCADIQGRLVFREVPVGTYELSMRFLLPLLGCRAPATLPSVVVTDGDLGGTVDVTVILQCNPPSPNTRCSVVRYPVTRIVDMYIGSLTDPKSGETLVEGFEVSEAVPLIFVDEFMRYGNPIPSEITFDALAPWTLDGEVDSVGKGWGLQPDWDGNARQALLDQFAEAGVPFLSGEPELVGSQDVAADVGIDFVVIAPWGGSLADYPECEAGTQTVEIAILYMATVNVYRLNATVQEVVEEPTPLPTPGPALCQTEAMRELTAYYGVVTDPDTGEVIASGLALSDRVPPGIRDAIERGDAPEVVAALIEEWEDADATDLDWPGLPADGMDAEAELRAQLGAAGDDVRFGEPAEGGTRDYQVTTLTYADETRLPDGCFVAAWARLIPIDATTIARVRFVQLNAMLGGEPAPSPTPSPAPSGTPAPHPTPAATATPTPGDEGTLVTTLPVTGTPARQEPSGLLPLVVLTLLALAALAAPVMRRRAR